MASFRSRGGQYSASDIHKDYKKDRKVGEGASAVVNKGNTPLDIALIMSVDSYLVKLIGKR